MDKETVVEYLCKLTQEEFLKIIFWANDAMDYIEREPCGPVATCSGISYKLKLVINRPEINYPFSVETAGKLSQSVEEKQELIDLIKSKNKIHGTCSVIVNKWVKNDQLLFVKKLKDLTNFSLTYCRAITNITPFKLFENISYEDGLSVKAYFENQGCEIELE